MSYITTYTRAQLKQIIAEEYASLDVAPAKTDPGSALGSIFDAEALIAILLQRQVIYALGVSRFATSSYADSVTFAAPFGITPLGPSTATVLEQFTTPSAVVGSPLVIPAGTIVQTPDGLQFTLLADLSILVGDTTASGLVQCVAPGTIGNVAANTITQLYSGTGSTPLAAVVNVTNPDAATNGVDQESLASFKARFTLAVSSGRVATRNAIAAAILAVQAGLTYAIGDRENPDGSEHAAFFSVIVNELGQNSGPSSPLLAAVAAAVETVRSAGVSYVVQGPTLVAIDATATIVVQAGFLSSVVITAVQNAYVAYLDSIGLDPMGGTTTVSFGKVYAQLLGVAGVFDVKLLTLNGDVVDITAPFGSQLVAGTPTFVPG